MQLFPSLLIYVSENMQYTLFIILKAAALRQIFIFTNLVELFSKFGILRFNSYDFYYDHMH